MTQLHDQTQTPLRKEEVPTEMTPQVQTDTELLTRFQQGEENAATVLYDRYAPRLRAMARGQCSSDLSSRVDADDILQSVFRSFFRRAAVGKYHVPDGEELWKLLVVMTLNKIRSTGDYHRAQKRSVHVTDDSPESMAQVGRQQSSGEHTLRELRLLIADIIQQLPPVQQQIVRLRLDGYEIAEIAEQSTRSKRTVERVLQDFRREITSKLREDPHE